MKALTFGDSCANGHVLTPETVHYRKVGDERHPRCGVCARAAARRYDSGPGRAVKMARLAARMSVSGDSIRALSRASKRKQYGRHRDLLRARVSAWRMANPEKVRAWHRQPSQRVSSAISRAIRKALADRKAGRTWESIVGFTLSELMTHLERRFMPGMTWANFGQWEIDHIRPKSSFDFSSRNDEACRACWALENLQPLWMSDNRRKWAHYDGVR